MRDISPERLSSVEIAELSARLVVAQMRHAQSATIAIALHLLGWLVFGTALWIGMTVLFDASEMTFELSSRPWLAAIPLAAAVASLISAYRSDRELRETERDWYLSRLAAMTREGRN